MNVIMAIAYARKALDRRLKLWVPAHLNTPIDHLPADAGLAEVPIEFGLEQLLSPPLGARSRS
jgi:hypothetical protein